MSSTTQAVGYIPTVREDTRVTGRRVLATLIDGLILGAAYNFLVLAFGDLAHPRAWQWNGFLDDAIVNITYGIAVLAYYILLEGFVGQTLGKMVTGIAVVREGDGTSPGIGAAAIRTVLRAVDGLLGYFVAFVAVLLSAKRQRLGDMAAGTLVVRTGRNRYET